MKKQLYLLCLLFAILALPLMIYATEAMPTITLNNLNYKAEKNPLIIKDTLFLSGPDLAAMTYGTYKQSDKLATLTIQNHIFTYDLITGKSTHNGINYLPEARIQLIDQSIVYFPITLLDDCDYPYSYTNNHLSLTACMPYSPATDQAKDHRTFQTTIKDYSELLTPLLNEEEAHKLVADAKKQHYYISFISLDHKKECFSSMKNLYYPIPTMNVHFRQVEQAGSTPTLMQLDTYPISYRFDEDTLSLSFDKNKLSSPCFWAAYDPYSLSTAIDINKSFDIMILRLLYEYYRDSLQLKDDVSLSPILKMTYARSDYMIYDVYMPSDSSHKHYQLILYKCTGANTIDYYIDLLKQ